MRFFPYVPEADPLQVGAAWRRYVEGGELQREQLRPHVVRAWERSRLAGCSPHLPRADQLTPVETSALLKRERRLVEIGTPFLVALSRAAGEERHAAMLADGQGRLLKIVGDPETMADEDFPHAGALLSEKAAGANGIGTTLAEGHYVELVGPEHYIEGFQVFTCQGVPLIGPSAVSSGALSMSVRRVEAANKVRDILFCASEAAECELLAAWLSDDLIGGDTLAPMLEALRQDMIQRITMARLQLELAARHIASGADATTTLRAAQELSRKFRRQASIWQDLIGEGEGAPEKLVLADLVADFVDLMDTEARVAGVSLRWGAAERIAVLEDPKALSQRLLAAFLSAIQEAARDSDVRIEVRTSEGHGVVALYITRPGGTSVIHRACAPVVGQRRQGK